MAIKTRWVIRLEDEASLKVKEGQKVVRGEVLGKHGGVKIKPFAAAWILKKLPKTKLAEWVNGIKGKKFDQGELMLKVGGWWGKKLLAPVKGRLVGVDEFLNLNFDVGLGEAKEIVCPVDAKLEKVSKEKLELVFRAEEYEAESVVAGMCWGIVDFELKRREEDLSVEDRAKIILTEEADASFLFKAEVVGAAAVLVCKLDGNEDVEGLTMPVVKLTEANWQKLLTEKKKERQALVDAKEGRLLLVV